MRLRLLGAILGALFPACRGAAGPPAETARYEAVLHRGRALQAEVASGRMTLVPGPGDVLVFEGGRGNRLGTLDTNQFWTLAVELPATPPGGATVALPSRGAFARVAGEDVLWLSLTVAGQVTLAPLAGEKVEGSAELKFVEPAKNLIERADLALSGPFTAQVQGQR